MSQKRWKLVLTELGSAGSLQETVVEASDWMTALNRARAQIGERGGVPPGASCSIAADGRVSIVDAIARRQYLLAVTTEATPAAPAPVPVAAAPAPVAAPKAKVSKATMAYMPSPVAQAAAPAPIAVGSPTPASISVAPGSVAPGSVAPGSMAPGSMAPGSMGGAIRAPSEPPRAVSVPRPSDRPAKTHNKTASYSNAEVRAAAELFAKAGGAPASAEAPASVAPASVAPASVAPASVAPAVAPASVAPASVAPASVAPAVAPAPVAPVAPEAGPRKKVSRRTMAYLPDDVAKAIANQAAVVVGAPAASPSTAPAPVAPVAAAAPIEPLAAVAPTLTSPPPPAAVVEAAPVAPPAAQPERPAEPASDGIELLHSRDAEPTKESPLIYRERHYFVPRGLADDEVEMILRRKFAALREELSSRPKGKLVKMALFDHRFTSQPERPPILALQWKDWRGEPELIAPGRTSMPGASIAPTSAPPAVVAPAVVAPAVVEPAVVAPAVVEPAPTPAASVQPPAQVESIIVDPVVYSPSSPPPPMVPPHAREESIVVDALAYTPSEPPPPAEPPRSIVAAQQPVAQQPVAQQPVAQQLVAQQPAALGSWRRSRKSTPGGALTDDRLADAFEGLQDLFFLGSAFEGVEFVVRLIGELIPSEAISVALYDINTNELRFVSTTGIGAEERKGDAIPISAGLLGAAVNDWTRSLHVGDVASDPRFDPGIDGRVGLDAVNMLIMPIAAQGRLLALVQLSNRIGDLDYSQSDANLITYIGGRLGEFLLQTKMSADRPSKRAPAAQR